MSAELIEWARSMVSEPVTRNGYRIFDLSKKPVTLLPSGPLPQFDFEKTIQYKGLETRLKYRVFVSKNENRDLIALKTPIK